jgi:hypothetical protein
VVKALKGKSIEELPITLVETFSAKIKVIGEAFKL